MEWRGDKSLPKKLILFIGLTAVLLGELYPSAQQFLNGQYSSTTKQPVFDFSLKGVGSFVALTGMYLVFAGLFWLLYRLLNWKIVAVLAAVFGNLLEFKKYHTHESNGLANISHPLQAIIFFSIIYPILLTAPYLIYKFLSKKWGPQVLTKLIVVVVVLMLIGLTYEGFAYRQWLSAHPGAADTVSGRTGMATSPPARPQSSNNHTSNNSGLCQNAQQIAIQPGCAKRN